VYHEGPCDPFRLRFIAHRKSVGPVTQKRIAIESHPLARELLAVLPEPFLFRQPGSLRRCRDRDFSDGQHHMLLLRERQRSERPQDAVFEYSFQMLHHYFILGCPDSRVRAVIRWGATLGDEAKVQIAPGDIGSNLERSSRRLVFESMDLDPQRRVYLTLFVFFVLPPGLAVGFAGAADFFASNSRAI
jgi:hypothetical protein